MADAAVPPAIAKIQNKITHHKRLTPAEVATYTQWKASQSGTTKTYLQSAIGVQGGKVFDAATGQFIDYAPGTYSTQFQPNADQAGAAAFLSGPSQIPIQHPRYYEGDEFRPASDLDVQGRIDLQNKLKALGMYGTDDPDIIMGVWGPLDMAAYSKALGSANAAGTTIEDWFANSAKLAGPGGAKLKKRDPLTISLTNPDDIRNIIQSGSKAMHNTYLSEDEVQKFISGYQDQERQAQVKAYYADDPNDGKIDEFVQAPGSAGLDEQVQRTIRETHPEQFMANTFTDRLDEMLGGLRGTTPTSMTQVGR